MSLLQKGGDETILQPVNFDSLSDDVKRDPGNIIFKTFSANYLLGKIQPGDDVFSFFNERVKEQNGESLSGHIGKYLFIQSARGIFGRAYFITTVWHVAPQGGKHHSRKSRKQYRSRKTRRN